MTARRRARRPNATPAPSRSFGRRSPSRPVASPPSSIRRAGDVSPPVSRPSIEIEDERKRKRNRAPTYPARLDNRTGRRRCWHDSWRVPQSDAVIPFGPFHPRVVPFPLRHPWNQALRERRRSRDASPCAVALRCSLRDPNACDSEADVEHRNRRRSARPTRGTTISCIRKKRCAATVYANLAIRGAGRVLDRGAGIVILGVAIEAAFLNVPMHVVQTPRVRALQADFSWMTVVERVAPCITVQ